MTRKIFLLDMKSLNFNFLVQLRLITSEFQNTIRWVTLSGFWSPNLRTYVRSAKRVHLNRCHRMTCLQMWFHFFKISLKVTMIFIKTLEPQKIAVSFMARPFSQMEAWATWASTWIFCNGCDLLHGKVSFIVHVSSARCI